LRGRGHRLAGRLVGGEVDHRLDLAVVDHLLDQPLVLGAANDERRLADGGAVPVLEGVEHDDLVAPLPQQPDRVRTDVAGSAGQEYTHVIHSSPSRRGPGRLPDHRFWMWIASPCAAFAASMMASGRV